MRMAGLSALTLSALALLAAGPLQAAVVTCGRAGVSYRCAPAAAVTPAAGPAGPVVNPSPGVGYGAPGVGPNTGGPVNRAGWR